MNKQVCDRFQYFHRILQSRPDASAEISGSDAYPCIKGRINFYQTPYGVIVYSDVCGLPVKKDECKKEIFAFHIHSGCSCTGNESDPFADAMMHYNPCDCEHPYHAGDLLPLWENGNGCAFEMFLTDRFMVDEIIGRTVIIHLNYDDFSTQPAGNAGEKIACGVIKKMC